MAEQTNIQNNIVIPNKSFYYKDQFAKWSNFPCAYALDIEIEKYFESILHFPLDRIIYASNDFCFRERTKKNNGQLNLPFMNYYKIGYTEVDRDWFNNYANLIGLMDIGEKGYFSQIGTQIQIVPIRIEYEATIFFNQHKDCEYAYSQLALQDSNERVLYPILNVNNTTQDTIKNIAKLTLDLEFNPTYNESDWLEQNKIFSIGCDFSFDTFMIYADEQSIFIAKEVVLEFLTAKHISIPDIEHSEITSALTYYFNS